MHCPRHGGRIAMNQTERSCVHGNCRMLKNKQRNKITSEITMKKTSEGDWGKGEKGFLQEGSEVNSFPSLTQVWMTEPWRVPSSLCWDPCWWQVCRAGPQILSKGCSGEQVEVLCSQARGYPHCKRKVSIWCSHEALLRLSILTWAAWHSVSVTYAHSSYWYCEETWMDVSSVTDSCKGMMSWTQAWFLHCSIRALKLGY